MIIYMFPGQGSQVPGMGKELFDLFPEHCERASQQLGYDLKALCLSDKAQQLNDTAFTQPALYVICSLSFLKENNNPDLVVGHSLGLYPALFAAKAFSFEQGLTLVAQRATLMAKVNNGSMMAEKKKKVDLLDDLLLQNGYYDIDIANYNSPTQLVLSGKQDRLNEFKPILEQLGYRVLPLTVSGAFHSRYMKQAATAFSDFLGNQIFRPLETKVISTTHGGLITENHLLEELTYQLVKPVRWRQTIDYLLKHYPNAEFQEIGPGKVLASLNQQIQALRIDKE